MSQGLLGSILLGLIAFVVSLCYILIEIRGIEANIIGAVCLSFLNGLVVTVFACLVDDRR